MIHIIITTCGEDETTSILDVVYHSTNNKDYTIWMLKDTSKKEMNYFSIYEYIENNFKSNNKKVHILEHDLNDNFAEHRNYPHRFIQKGDWVFQLDADEMVEPDFFKIIPRLIEENDEIELYYLARNNFVNGITKEYINRMRWKQDEYGRINYPDWQGRLYKYDDHIKWIGNVHEHIDGAKNYGRLKEDWSHITHIKDFEKQYKQNKYYNEIE